MNHPDPAFPGYSNRHAVFRNGIHCCTHHRHIQRNIICQLRLKVNIRREHVALGRHQKDVVKRQPFTDKTFFIDFLKAHRDTPLSKYFIYYTQSSPSLQEKHRQVHFPACVKLKRFPLICSLFEKTAEQTADSAQIQPGRLLLRAAAQ